MPRCKVIRSDSYKNNKLSLVSFLQRISTFIGQNIVGVIDASRVFNCYKTRSSTWLSLWLLPFPGLLLQLHLDRLQLLSQAAARGCGVWSWRWINFKTTPKITKCGEHMMKKVSSFGTVIRVEQEKYSLQLLTNSTVQMEVSYNRGIQKWMVSNGRSIYTWMILGSLILGNLQMEFSWNRGYPQIIHSNGIFPYKPSILGYLHFRTPPNQDLPLQEWATVLCLSQGSQHLPRCWHRWATRPDGDFSFHVGCKMRDAPILALPGRKMMIAMKLGYKCIYMYIYIYICIYVYMYICIYV